MIRDPKKYFIIYLAILTLAGAVLIYLAASKVGPGISNDAAMMLSVAGNLVKNHVLMDFRGDVLTQFPPLYPLLLSIGSRISGQDEVIVGWVLNILIFCAIIWFSGIIFWNTFSEDPILAYMASFIIFSSTSLIKISTNIASDPLFMLIVILFLMSLVTYLSTGKNKFIILAGVLIVIGCSQRYAGLSLVPAGSLVVAYKYRKNIGPAIRSALIFAIPTATPVFLWGFLHNYPINGSVFGTRIPYMPLLNFVAGSIKLLNWFIPLQIISFLSPLVLYTVILITLIYAIFRTGLTGFLSKLDSPLIIPHIAFLVIYFGVLVFNITPELQGPDTDRAHIISLPSLLIILFTIASYLLKAARIRFGTVRSNFVLIILFLAWSIYPLSRTVDYVQRSMVNGDVSSYNSLNKANIKNMPINRYLSGLDTSNSQFYSNGEAAVWLILRVQVHSLPQSYSSHKPTLSYLAQNYSGWPSKGNDGYLVWFNSFAYKDYLATPEELNTIATLNKIYSDEDGTVYALKSR
jgi:hypothetical protein